MTHEIDANQERHFYFLSLIYACLVPCLKLLTVAKVVPTAAKVSNRQGHSLEFNAIVLGDCVPPYFCASTNHSHGNQPHQ